MGGLGCGGRGLGRRVEAGIEVGLGCTWVARDWDDGDWVARDWVGWDWVSWRKVSTSHDGSGPDDGGRNP